ncbi:unnamed protein product [Mytilus coruscus]|uniref:C3H1-type domain-containing protein n=1 Tax=Mytilus coruscus TaxID=42192 RepID=A0A6J8BT23_MYTCO|nr:unnamed protein product [Mytilus coruscus]
MLKDLQSKYDSLESEIERLRLEKSMSKRTITSPSSDVKPDSATAKAIQEIQNVSRGTNNANYKDQNSGFNSYNKKGKGPFLPDGRTICRRFNTGDCYRKDCKLAHHCAICYAKNHNASQHSTSFQFRQANSVSTQQPSQSEFSMHGSKKEGTTESTYDRCSAALNCLIQLLRKLGFYINWNKVEGPSQRLIFLGILIDTCGEELRARLYSSVQKYKACGWSEGQSVHTGLS